MGCRTIVTGARGPNNLTGNDLKLAVKDFGEKMKPHLKVAEEMNVIEPRHMVATQLKTLTPVGTAINIVQNIKNSSPASGMPVVNM